VALQAAEIEQDRPSGRKSPQSGRGQENASQDQLDSEQH